MLRFTSRASRVFARSYSAKSQRANSSKFVPVYTLSACALTSSAMYYYLFNKVQNDSSEPEKNEQLAAAPVEVIEVIDIVDPQAETELVIETEVQPEAETEGSSAEEGQQSAYNEETGEINWDCPCLGGMADGPCGEEFKAAFSCFVYSQEEPKGIECIEKFKGMQDCFRKYPEVYSEELRDEEELAKETGVAVVNNDIIESIEEATEEAKEIISEVEASIKEAAKPAFDLYGAAQKKIDDFNKK
ncbi:Mia40 protein [Martiniozyma asiatica (nom. inval.)]|nr:Mia40 protein [Martiniozyma asiatica]